MGTVIGSPVAIDPDGDPLSYSLQTNIDRDGDGNLALRLENGQLIVNDTGDFDFEMGSQFTVIAGVTDGTASDTAEITVELLDVNEPPTLSAIDDITIDEDTSEAVVAFEGVGPGLGNTDTVTITARSSRPDIIPHPIVTYNAPDTTGSLAITPVADRFGAADITITVTDPQGAKASQTLSTATQC